MKMTIDIEPKPCPRPRFGKRAYMPAEYQKYKAAIGALVKSKCKTPTTDNLKLQITFRRNYRAGTFSVNWINRGLGLPRRFTRKKIFSY